MEAFSLLTPPSLPLDSKRTSKITFRKNIEQFLPFVKGFFATNDNTHHYHHHFFFYHYLITSYITLGIIITIPCWKMFFLITNRLIHKCHKYSKKALFIAKSRQFLVFFVSGSLSLSGNSGVSPFVCGFHMYVICN